MKALVDRLSNDLADRYVGYLESLLVDLWSADGGIEFRCGFSLRSDHQLRSITIKIPALAGETDRERGLIIAAVFDEIEDMLDNAIAENRSATN